MRTLLTLAIALVSVACPFAFAERDIDWHLKTDRASLPPLPEPVSNNAVASVVADGTEYLVSFNGLGAGRTHADTHANTFVFAGKSWREADPVPGGVGRLASVAVSARGRAWVFGGYTVAADGAEVSTPWAHSFDPTTDTFEEHASIPVPVDDAVAVVYKDRYIYLISGWHDYGNVNLVQRYDIDTDSWDQATPTPGPAVFGHAGGIAGGKIVYCDGVVVAPKLGERRAFEATNQCFVGIIDREDPRRIDWRRIRPHPGPARYRMAAGSPDATGVMFLGGTDNPYNFDGIGYNAVPSEPLQGAFFFDVGDDKWYEFETPEPATMDHRGLVFYNNRLVTIGGMQAGQRVISDVYAYGAE